MLSAERTKNGTHLDPANIDNYLGEKAHAVLIHQDSKAFVHVHPELRNGRFVLRENLQYTGCLERNRSTKKPGAFRLRVTIKMSDCLIFCR